MIPSFQKLIVRPGDEVSADLWNAMVKLVATISPHRSAGTRRRFLPGGVITSIHTTSARPATVDHPFKLTVVTSEETEIRFRQGLIGGVEPTIDRLPISHIDPVTGERPAFKVTADAFSPIGADRFQSLLYFRITLNTDWNIKTVQPEALAEPPKSTPWTAWKLVAILLRDGEDGAVAPRPFLFQNQSFAASQRRPNGHFKPWFSAQ